MTMAIRAFEARWAEATARLWLDSFLSSGVRTNEAAPLQALVDRIHREVASDWDAYLAWEGERLVGFLALKPTEFCLDQIFIAPDAKRAGRGTALLDFAKARLPSGLWLRAAADNGAARRFYEKHGFRFEAEEPHPRFGHPTVIYRWP